MPELVWWGDEAFEQLEMELKMTKKEMAVYLRCTNLPHNEKLKECSGCPYYMLQEVEPDYPVPPDVVKDGIGYWTYCDYEQICSDAAAMLEEE